MTPKDIAAKADSLRKQIAEMPRVVPNSFGYGKYVKLETEMKQLLNDVTVLLRELADGQIQARADAINLSINGTLKKDIKL